MPQIVVRQSCRPTVYVVCVNFAISCVPPVQSAPVPCNKMLQDGLGCIYSVCVWTVAILSNNVYRALTSSQTCLTMLCPGSSPIMLTYCCRLCFHLCNDFRSVYCFLSLFCVCFLCCMGQVSRCLWRWNWGFLSHPLTATVRHCENYFKQAKGRWQ